MPAARAMPEMSRWNLVLARWLGWVSAGLGGIILFGWLADVPILKSLQPHEVEAKVNTAVCFVLLGVALGLTVGAAHRGSRWRSGLVGIFAGLTALTGLLTLAEYLFHWNPGLDELLLSDSADAAYTVFPGRMAVPTAFNFLLLGTAILLLYFRRARASVVALVLPASALAGMAFIGQLYGLPNLLSFGPFTPIAAPTGMIFLILSLGALMGVDNRTVTRWSRSARLIGFVLALLMLLLMAGAVWHNTRALIGNSRQVTHTYAVLEKLADTLSAMQDVETGTRGYLLTGDRSFLEPALAAFARTDGIGADLRRLTADNPAQQRRFSELEPLLDGRIALSRHQAAMREQGGAGAAGSAADIREGKRQMDGIRRVVATMQAEEQRLLQERQAHLEVATNRTLLTLGLGLTACLGLLLTIFSRLNREIVRRAQSEAALRRSEESLAVTLHSIGDGVLATDTAGAITLMNRVAEELTGWTLAEAAGRPVAEVFQIINEETRASAPIPVDDVLATGEIKGLANHTALVARDGRERPIADSAAPIRDADGRLLGVVLVFRDVTAEQAARHALRASEVRYRTLFDSIDEGFCIIEVMFDEQDRPVDYRFLEINPSFEKQTGLQNALGKTMRELSPGHEAHWFETYGRIARTGEAARFHNRAEQLHRTFDVYAFRLGEPKNRQVAILFNDITRSKEAEAVLTLRTAQLETANRELESFSYSVSHDLRAPLRHVQGYVEMLTRESKAQLSEKATRYLLTISAAAREMGELIDDLLAFSRMGRSEMREATVDLATLAAEARAGLGATVADRNICWKTGPLPAVRGDAAMIRQVLVNLLGNAVKYTRPCPRAEIELGSAGEEEGRTVLFVRDNGAGFDMNYADKLFGVFQRLHRADEFEGTGIGLASVRRIITRHGGRTWAEGRVNAGATFYFTLAPATAERPPTPDES
jgi:PAS domain S-box-containing protein